VRGLVVVVVVGGGEGGGGGGGGVEVPKQHSSNTPKGARPPKAE